MALEDKKIGATAEMRGADNLLRDLAAMQKSFEDLGTSLAGIKMGDEAFASMDEKVREAHKSMRAIQMQIKREGFGAAEVRALQEASQGLEDELVNIFESFSTSEFADPGKWKDLQVQVFKLQDGLRDITELKSDLDRVTEGLEGMFGEGERIKGVFRGMGKESPLRTFFSSRRALQGFGKRAIQVGKTMQKMGGVTGKVGGLLSKVGTAATGTTGAVLGITFAAVGAGVALLKMADSARRVNARLVEMSGAIEIMESGMAAGGVGTQLTLGDLRMGVRETREALRKFSLHASKSTISLEETTKAYEAMLKTGLRQKELKKRAQNVRGALDTVATASLQLGTSLNSSAEIVASQMLNTGASAEGLKNSFALLSRTAASTGMSTAHFASTVMSLSGDASVLSGRMANTGKQVAFFGNALGVAAGAKMVGHLKKLGGSAEELRGHLIMISQGPGGPQALKGLVQKALKDRILQFAETLKGVDTGMTELPEGIAKLQRSLNRGADISQETLMKFVGAIHPEEWENMPVEVGEELRSMALVVGDLTRAFQRKNLGIDEAEAALLGLDMGVQVIMTRLRQVATDEELREAARDATKMKLVAGKAGIRDPEVAKQAILAMRTHKKSVGEMVESMRETAGVASDLVRQDEKAWKDVKNELTGTWTYGINKMVTVWDKVTDHFVRAIDHFRGNTDKALRKMGEQETAGGRKAPSPTSVTMHFHGVKDLSEGSNINRAVRKAVEAGSKAPGAR